MGKQREKKKKHGGGKFHGTSNQQKNTCQNSYDRDAAAFISLSQELKEEGNRLFQTRDYEEAMLMYGEAIKLLPRSHADVSYLRSNMAACYMQFGESEYPRAIHECNLALEVNPECTKAVLKRARCYEALNRLDLALRDARRVLLMEPNNFMAAEIAEMVKAKIEQNGGAFDIPVDLIPVPEYIEPATSSACLKPGKKKGLKIEKKIENDKVHAKGNQSKKRGRKKAKNKKVADRVHVEKAKGMEAQDMTNELNNVEDNEFGSGIDVKKAENRKEERKKKKKRVRNGVYGIDDIEGMNASDTSDAEEDSEYNHFGILTDFELDSSEIEEKKDKNNPLVPNGVTEMPQEDNMEDGKSEIGADVKKKVEKKVNHKVEEMSEGRRAEDKLVVEEIMTGNREVESERRIKLIFGDDIRYAQVPVNCSIFKLREIICSRFPICKAILIKYKDQEGDLITITTNEELRWAETSVDHSFTRLYIVDVNPDQDPLLEKIKQEKDEYERMAKQIEIENARRTELQNDPSCVDDWIIHFAYLFKNYAGFESDCYLSLHDVGVKLYSEAMEETVTSEEAQDIFSTAEEKFREMAALALFNWGNVVMSRARRRVFTEYSAGESVQDAHSWAQKEYSIAGRRFEEAMKMNPNFYEGIIALGQLQFEQAKLSWYYATTTGADLQPCPSSEIFQLYNNAGKNMERGIQMWEESLVQHIIEVTNQSETDKLLQQMKLDNLFNEISAEEAAEQAANIRSQVNLLWGTMLYERSVMEFKLGLPAWQDRLEAAADKFELAGASPEDIAVMIKNHCSNSLQGVNVDETEQAWNEMYEAIRWQMDIPALHLEPLLQKRVTETQHALDHP